jgi:uncharacterized protein (UPF0262 family)
LNALLQPDIRHEEKERLRSVVLVRDEDAGAHDPLLDSEEKAALHDLVQESAFSVLRHLCGPYDLTLTLSEDRLVMDMAGVSDTPLPSLILSARPYRTIIRDYRMMVESYTTVRHHGNSARIEAIDMGRRGLHNEGATLLQERLADKISMDHGTARRLFTLICVLHGAGIRGRMA